MPRWRRKGITEAGFSKTGREERQGSVKQAEKRQGSVKKKAERVRGRVC